jgi:hypothetical protein
MSSFPARVWLSLTTVGLVAACAGEDAKPPFVCRVDAPTECPSPTPVYADVQPILERRCVTCHSATSTGPWPLTTYQDVTDWYDVIRDEVLHCTMPPPEEAPPLTAAESRAILEWIRCDYPR